jgi:uncharacterized protein (DUF2062 family)
VKRVSRLFALSHQGVSTETLVLSIGLALVLGVFPVYGCPTLLCAAAAIVLRLNLPAMQLVNLLTCPLQLALLIPFHRLGAFMLPGVSVTDHSRTWGFLAGIWTMAVHAIAGWSCVCVPLGLLLYTALRVSRRLTLNPRAAADQATGTPATQCESTAACSA